MIPLPPAFLSFLPPSQAPALELSRRWTWLSPIPAWVFVLLIVPSLAGIAWWSYRRERDLPRNRKSVLAVLRFLGLLLLLVASLRPALESTKSVRIRNEIHFLLDDSASMSRHEVYASKRRDELQAALGKTGLENLSSFSRAELAGLLLSPDSPTLPGGRLARGLASKFDLRWFRFSTHPSPITGPEDLEAKGRETRIGDSLELHLSRSMAEGGRLESLILVTDGRNTGGLPPLEAAARYKSAEIPIHVLGVGDPDSDKNLSLSGPPGPKEVLVGEEAEFECTIEASGLERTQGELNLEIAEWPSDRPAPSRGVVSESAGITCPSNGKELRVTLRHRFEKPGDYLLTFRVPPLPGESNPEDNVVRRYLRVDPNRILVLYLEDRPRWEYRYLERALKRVDESIRFQALLFEGSPFAQQSSKDLPPLTALPRTRKELFRYHVVLLGDVDPRHLGDTEEERSSWLELLRDFVEHGGGLGLISGSTHMPESYRGTLLEDLLPVVLGRFGEDEEIPLASGKPFSPALENPERPHPTVRLSRFPLENKRIWDSRLPPLYWYYPVLRAKAGATVILRHPRDGNRYGKRVLTAIAPYPEGQVWFSAIDSTWRWRKLYGEKYQDRYWRNVVRTLAETKLRRKDDRIELRLNRESVVLGSRVTVSLKLLDEDYAPVIAKEARIHIRKPDRSIVSKILLPVEDRPGLFEGVVPAEAQGMYSFLFYKDGVPSGPPRARRDLTVLLPRKELARVGLDESGLKKLAKASGGTYRPLSRLGELLPLLAEQGGGTKILERKVREIWDSIWMFLLVFALFTIEWILRKRWRLV